MKPVFLLFLLFLPGCLMAQFSGLPPMFPKEIQEKVYLHTDKSHYMAGEHIWFRAYRTDASAHIPTVYSRFVYVELYDAMDRFERRIKVMERNGVFQGSFPLDPFLPSGRYTLRAYTYYMQNFDEAFYFQKEIVVENRKPEKVWHEVVWDTTSSGDWLMSVRFLSGNGTPYPKLSVDSRQYCGQRETEHLVTRTDATGRMQLRLKRKDNVTAVRFKFSDNEPFEYRWIVNVPVRLSPEAIDVQFFPEGGNLLAGVTSRVGFKAVGTDGLGVNISGEVFRHDGTVMEPFVSLHRGMGYFELKPESGSSYYAEIILPGGGRKRVDLPTVQEQGTALRMETHGDVLHWQCLSTPDYLHNREMYLLLHSRGKILSVLPAGEGECGTIPLRFLPPGILHGILTDAEGNVYSSRLSLVLPQQKDSLHLSTDRKHYGKRDSVFLSLSWTGSDSLSCSVAVTDPELDGEKRWDNNIVSYFLMDSDLKGHIEDPGCYFDTEIPVNYRQRMAEVLLLTQGWQRFEIGKGVQSPRPLPFFLELTQGFAGEVRNFWGRPAKKPCLFAIVPRLKLIKEIALDSKSRFEFCVEFPDSTEFIFHSFTRTGKKWTALKLRHDLLREVQIPLMTRQGWQEKEEESLSEAFREVETLGYDYVNGEKIYRLEEAVVTKPVYGPIGKPLKVLKERDLKERRFRNALELVASVPGVDIGNTEGVRYIVSRRHVNIILEGMKEDFSELYMLDLLAYIHIKYIDRMEYNISGNNINIFISLKKGTDFTLRGLNFYRFTPLGYHKPAEFYIPRYDVAEERNLPQADLRSTLYWNPDVRLQQGDTTTLRFYTTDRKGPFRVKVEGTTPKGEIVRTTLNIGEE